jgi:hypothetical protein
MAYKSDPLLSLLKSIKEGSLLLPHIQRKFVWSEDKMALLLDSLLNDYPIQTLLFWKTSEGIRVRKFQEDVDYDAQMKDLYDEQKSMVGVEKALVLDGQQRLQALYAMFYGSITSVRKRKSVSKNAYLDLAADPHAGVDRVEFFSDEELAKQKLPEAEGGALQRSFWYKLKELPPVAAQKPSALASELLKKRASEVPPGSDDVIRSNFDSLHNVLHNSEIFYYNQLDQGLNSAYNLTTVLDIFIRVNSGATKLPPYDLFFAKLKGNDDEIEAKIENCLTALNKSGMGFENDTALKCILVSEGKGSQIKDELFDAALLASINSNWQHHKAAFDQLSDFIKNRLLIYGEKALPGYVVFTPIYHYLFLRNKFGLSLPDEREYRKLISFYYSSIFFGWFALHTDTHVSAVGSLIASVQPAQQVSPVGKSLDQFKLDGFPLANVRAYFSGLKASAAKRTEFVESDLDAEGKLKLAILDCLYSKTTGHSAFSNVSDKNQPHVDHIYPQSPLLKQIFGVSRKKMENGKYAPVPQDVVDEINDIGNMHLLGADPNIRKNDELPAEYFGSLYDSAMKLESDPAKASAAVLKFLTVPAYSQNPRVTLEWSLTAFRAFVKARRALILESMSEVVNFELRK